MVMLSFPVAASPEAYICPDLTQADCQNTTYYLLFHLCVLVATICFITQIAFGLCFVHIVSRPYCEIDCCISFNLYGRKFDAFSTFCLYTGIIALLISLICCAFQRNSLMGIFALILSIISILLIVLAYIETSLPLTRKQGERARMA